MKKFSLNLNSVIASLEAQEDDENESSDAVDESVPDTTPAKSDDDKPEETTEGKPEDEGDTAKEEGTPVEGDPVIPEEEKADESDEADLSEGTTDTPAEEPLPEPAEPIELSKTEEAVPVKSPEESAEEVSNQEVALDMESVGALEELRESLVESAYIPVTGAAVYKLAVNNLKLSFGMESFGLTDDFEIKTDRERDLLVDLITDKCNRSRGHAFGVGNEEDTGKGKLERLKAFFKELIAKAIDTIKRLSQWVKDITKKTKAAVSEKLAQLKAQLSKIKDDGEITYSVSGIQFFGCPVDKNGNLRLGNINKTNEELSSLFEEYNKLINNLATLIDVDNKDQTSYSLGQSMKSIRTHFDNISAMFNTDFGVTSEVTMNALNVHDFIIFRLTLPKDSIKIELKSSAVKAIIDGKELTQWLNTSDLWFDSLSVDVARSLNKLESKLSTVTDSGNSETIQDINKITTALIPQITAIGKYHNSIINEVYRFTNQLTKLTLGHTPSTESYHDDLFTRHDVIQDPVLRMKAFNYNLDNTKPISVGLEETYEGSSLPKKFKAPWWNNVEVPIITRDKTPDDDQVKAFNEFEEKFTKDFMADKDSLIKSMNGNATEKDLEPTKVFITSDGKYGVYFASKDGKKVNAENTTVVITYNAKDKLVVEDEDVFNS
jgi:hypothetical protein